MKINISPSFLALTAALAVSTSAAHAQTLVDTDFSSATPTGSGLDAWSTDGLNGHLSFGPSGAVSTGPGTSDTGYYTTTADFSSTIGLSSTPTWLAVTMSLGAYNGLSTSTSFGLNLGLTGDSTSFTFGSKPLGSTAPGSPAITSPDWLTGFESNNYGGMFGGGTATPAGPTTYLLEISSDGSTVSGSVWAFNTALPSTPPTDGTGAANYGTFSFASGATGLSDVNLSGLGLAGTYSHLTIADDYADIVTPGAVPEPTTLGYLACGALGLAGLAMRRRFCR